MASFRVVFFWNSVMVLLVGVVSLATLGLNLFDGSVRGLFFPPCLATYPGAGLFFLAFQMLFYLAVMVCLFTYGLLRLTQPVGVASLREHRQENKFILYSALFTGYFLFNEVFRTHVHLGRMGIPKVLVVASYFGLAIVYGVIFRRQIQQTPYLLLVSGVALLAIAFLAEGLMTQLDLGNDHLESIIEGIPKLLSGVNTALYFWFTCRDQLLRSLNFSRPNFS
ncbi:MAG: hypothetical protein HC916_07940 [Coleofasciculaceae cyanobacterium SM2_1_6]|nr:hypothetical protein [Coleofasciculaceae cyanobacterium SM2_1_6]